MYAMAFGETLQAKGIRMRAKAADQRVDGIKLRVPKKTYPQFEIAAIAAGIVHPAAGTLPQAAAPKRRFLLDVTIRSREEKYARPAAQFQDLHCHAVIAEAGGTPRDPLHLGEFREHAADHEQVTGVHHASGADPPLQCPGRVREAFVDRVIHPAIGFADPAMQVRLVALDDI